MTQLSNLQEHILTEIKRYNDINEPIWRQKLVDTTNIPENMLIDILGELCSLGFITGEWDEVIDGYVIRTHFIYCITLEGKLHLKLLEHAKKYILCDEFSDQ